MADEWKLPEEYRRDFIRLLRRLRDLDEFTLMMNVQRGKHFGHDVFTGLQINLINQGLEDERRIIINDIKLTARTAEAIYSMWKRLEK
jgi:hypothetical protein